MGKKYFSKEGFETFKGLYHDFISIKTWTKEKHALKQKMLSFLLKHQHYIHDCHRHSPKFSNGAHYLKWDYEIVKIPSTKKGFFKLFHDKAVFIFCVDHQQLKGISLMVILSNIKEEYLFEKRKAGDEDLSFSNQIS